jgi:hypothetical protein
MSDIAIVVLCGGSKESPDLLTAIFSSENNQTSFESKEMSEFSRLSIRSDLFPLRSGVIRRAHRDSHEFGVVAIVEIGQQIEVALVMLDRVTELRDLRLNHLLLRDSSLAMTLSAIGVLQVDHMNLSSLDALCAEEEIFLGHGLGVEDIEEFVEVFQEEKIL